jgi:hypothetical protein
MRFMYQCMIYIMNYKINEKGGWIIPNGGELYVDAPDFSEIGSYCEIGSGCKIGDGCEIGDGCIWEGLTVNRFTQISNLDGKGRTITIVSDGTRAVIRAGCFLGNPKSFAEKARLEGKLIYASVIPFIAQELIKNKK